MIIQTTNEDGVFLTKSSFGLSSSAPIIYIPYLPAVISPKADIRFQVNKVGRNSTTVSLRYNNVVINKESLPRLPIQILGN